MSCYCGTCEKCLGPPPRKQTTVWEMCGQPDPYESTTPPGKTLAPPGKATGPYDARHIARGAKALYDAEAEVGAVESTWNDAILPVKYEYLKTAEIVLRGAFGDDG